MQRLMSVLGMPQHRFASVHVVGTNGKSSVTLMTAALLEAHGLATGAYVSPHLRGWPDRIVIGGETVGEDAFAAAVQRTSEAAESVNRSLEEGDSLTQFEIATAAAFVSFAAAGVGAAVIEAGLGGRLDATNVIPSKLTVLTSISLDHTQWLGDTEAEIAGEKLAVLRDHSALVVGQLSEEVAGLASRTASERSAELVRAPDDPPQDLRLRAAGSFQRRNFAVAMSAAEAFLGRLDAEAVRRVAAALVVPGRLEMLEGDPPLVLDAAHNPAGAWALAEALPAVTGGRPVVACLAVLADKDAAGILRELVPACAALICTELPAAMLEGSGRPGAESLPAAGLADLARQAGAAKVEAVPDAGAALARARALAGELDGLVLVTGSHYLLGAI
jgi:dihydrofolate synthase/folylpolyglutamate synthase